MWAKEKGFTIVELLIVVVVIAILAAITIVSYNGIQQRANNIAIIDAASKAKRLIEAYVVTNNKYPYTVNDEYACITTTTSCRNNSGPMTATSVFDTEMGKIGSLPRSAPLISDVRGGITYVYNSIRTVDGVPAPAVIRYYLFGTYTDCGMKVLNGESTTASTVTTKYTVGDVGNSGGTLCIVSISNSGT